MPAENSTKRVIADGHRGRATVFQHVVFHHHVLRAGWGVVLFCVLFVAGVWGGIALVQAAAHYAAVQHAVMVPRDGTSTLVVLLAAAIATAVPSFLEQRRIDAYGFRGSPWPNLLLGLVTSAVLVTAMVFAMQAAGLLKLVWPATPLATALKYAAIWGAIVVANTLIEELLLRGYLQYTLARGFAFLYRRFLGFNSGVGAGFWSAALLLSAGFAALYARNTGETQVGLLCAFVMGLLYCLSLWRTGSLWWALGFHIAWDWTQVFVFGVPNAGQVVRDHLAISMPLGAPVYSGGTAGLDGSVFVFMALAAAGALLFATTKRQLVFPELWEIAAQEGSVLYADTLPDPDRA